MKSILLGQLFELNYGKSLPKGKRQGGEIPVYGSNGMVDCHNKSVVDKPTIVVGRKGSIGEVHLVLNPCWPIDTTYFVQPLGKYEYDLEWLYRLLKTRRLQNLNRSAAIPGLNRNDVYRIKIHLPPLDDQKRIAHLLGKVEGLIARRKQHLQQLDDLLKSVFLEMFGDPISNPKKYPVRKLSEFYINPKEGTKCGPFGSALKKDELVDSGIPVWNMDNIDPSGRMVLPFRMWITEAKHKELASYSVLDGDIIISRAGTVGKMCVASMDGNTSIISTNLIRLRLGDKFRPLHFVSLMTYCKGRVSRLKTGPDGTFTHMNTGILDKLEFPYPPPELQDQFASIHRKVDEIKSNYKQSLADLEQLYGALSQKAFKGELDLSRVSLPTIAGNVARELPSVEVEMHGKVEAVTYELPDPGDLKILESPEGRRELLELWLEAYLGQLGDTPFSTQHFMEAAQQKLWDLVEDETPEWGAAEYDQVKDWVFQSLENGRLQQSYDTEGNQVQITSAKS